MVRRADGDVIKRRRMCAAGFLALSLVSCGDEDRIATVTCSSPPSDSISVEMRSSDVKGRSIALLNTHQFMPGTILELSPAATDHAHGRGRVLYVLPTAEGDFLPSRAESWFENVVSASFQIQLDRDVDQALKPLNIDWERKITHNTSVMNIGAQRKALRDPLALVNADKRGVSLIQEGAPTSRFALVTAASYGKEVDLGYSAPSLAANTVDVQNFYLHLKYDCSSVAKINAIAHSSDKEASILFLFMAVKFDRAKRHVEVDSAPVDLTAFDLSP